MSLTSSFSPSTWRILGLGVAVAYTGLGLAAMLSPTSTSRVFGIPLGGGPVQNDSVSRSFKLVGVRDISIAAALFAFNSHDQPQAMGILISTTMILCAWDTYECARNNGLTEALFLGTGASLLGTVGLGLLGLRSFR